ncbi:hypothetical protein BYT27DRAFT_7255475 [Phlegmacium glaucopus]|nr:hypothetical protein BYT27DRAFT_7255475 [Phlegmacium glaucopus]
MDFSNLYQNCPQPDWSLPKGLYSTGYQSYEARVTANVFDKLDKLADSAAAVSTGEVRELQVVLESQVIDDRLPNALLVLKRELINVQLQNKFSRDVDSKIAKGQREYYNLKASRKSWVWGMELGKGFEEELCKMQGLEPTASEANVTRNYSDWWTQIPWGRHTPENYSITHAQTAVLQIQFGGLTDVAEIKGHIRTYVGALPGSAQIIQALKRVETENPLVLNDEVNKIGCGINGDLLGDTPWLMSSKFQVMFLEKSRSSHLGIWVLKPKKLQGDVYLGSSAADVLVKYYYKESGVRNISRRFIINLDLEDTFSEPKQPGAFTTLNKTPSEPIHAFESQEDRTPPEPVSALETREPPQNELISNHTATTAPETDQKKPVTTKERKPMHVHA